VLGHETTNRREALNAALRTNSRKGIRAEELENYRDFFVDPFDSATIEGNANQLIYGRRGSGKTLLLGALNDKLVAGFPQNRIASFSYRATDFRNTAEDGTQTNTVKENTHAFFRAFVVALSEDILSLADQVLKRPNWLVSLTLEGEARAAKRDALESAVLELVEAATYGIESPLPSSRETAREQRTTRSPFRQAGGKVEFSAAGRRPRTSLDARLWLERSARTLREETQSITEVVGREFSPARVRRLVLDVVDLLGLEYLVVFIDEWMSLAECQVDFAERLKQCLFGERKIAIKIAADEYQGQFNNAGRGHNFRGLDIGGDIFVAVDLDRPFLDRSRNIELFAEALYRRLLVFEPQLADHFGPAPLSNRELFVDALFATRQAFAELCTGSQGLCRDFHRLIQICAKQINWDVTESRIDTDCVRRALVKMNDEAHDRANRSAESHTLLYAVIGPHITQTGSRHFIVEAGPARFRPVLDDLLSKRIIHRVPTGDTHPSIRGKYDCYEIGYGMFIDLMITAQSSTSGEISEIYSNDQASAITATNNSAYVLDMTILASSEATTLLCSHCDAEFLSTERAYVLRRLCPHCFSEQ
jgi:hypothetical protein